jgi:glycosyltransferase involved in cell wall biosynthesis
LRLVLLGPAASAHIARWAGDLAAAGHLVLVASWQPGPPIAGAQLSIAPAVGARPVCRAALAASWLRRLVRQFRPDIIHVHSLGAYGLLALALPGRLAPVVVTPWGSELRAGRHSAARAAVIWLALRRADLALPTSGEAAAELAIRYRAPAARIRTLSWGVPDHLFDRAGAVSRAAVRTRYGVPPAATVVLSVRSATGTYRVSEIVTAFAAAAAQRPDLFLIVLAGHRSDRESARRAQDDYLAGLRAAAAGLAGRMLVVDRVLRPRQTFDLMCASDIAVSVPPGDQRSSSVLEAALAGCHLLLSDIPPYQELVKAGLAADLLREPLVVSLADALGDPRAPLARPRVNWEFITRHEHGSAKLAELEQLYRQLAGAHSGRPSAATQSTVK